MFVYGCIAIAIVPNMSFDYHNIPTVIENTCMCVRYLKIPIKVIMT